MRRWLAAAWIFLIAQGAATTGILRTALAAPAETARWAFDVHWIGGTTLVVLALASWVRSDQRGRWISALLVLATGAFGWLAGRGFDPRFAAAHAAVAAVAIVPVLGMGSRPLYRAAVLLVAAQVAIGAALRHQLIAVEWHLLFAGVAALAVLVPAVKIVNDPARPSLARRTARWAIAAIVSQVALGAAIFVMMMVGPPSAFAWLAVTVAHVTVGALTLVAIAAIARKFAEPS